MQKHRTVSRQELFLQDGEEIITVTIAEIARTIDSCHRPRRRSRAGWASPRIGAPIWRAGSLPGTMGTMQGVWGAHKPDGACRPLVATGRGRNWVSALIGFLA